MSTAQCSRLSKSARRIQENGKSNKTHNTDGPVERRWPRSTSVTQTLDRCAALLWPLVLQPVAFQLDPELLPKRSRRLPLCYYVSSLFASSLFVYASVKVLAKVAIRKLLGAHFCLCYSTVASQERAAGQFAARAIDSQGQSEQLSAAVMNACNFTQLKVLFSCLSFTAI